MRNLEHITPPEVIFASLIYRSEQYLERTPYLDDPDKSQRSDELNKIDRRKLPEAKRLQNEVEQMLRDSYEKGEYLFGIKVLREEIGKISEHSLTPDEQIAIKRALRMKLAEFLTGYAESLQNRTDKSETQREKERKMALFKAVEAYLQAEEELPTTTMYCAQPLSNCLFKLGFTELADKVRRHPLKLETAEIQALVTE